MRPQSPLGAACQAVVAPAGRRCGGDSGPGVRRVLAVGPPPRYLGSTGSRASGPVRRPEGGARPGRRLRVVLAEATGRGIGARLRCGQWSSIASGARSGIAALQGSGVGLGEAPEPAVPMAWACVTIARRARGAGRAEVRCRAWGRTRLKAQRANLLGPETRSIQGDAPPRQYPSAPRSSFGIPRSALTYVEPGGGLGPGSSLVLL